MIEIFESIVEIYGVLQDKVLDQLFISQWKDVWYQFCKYKGVVWGGGFFLFIILVVIVGFYVWIIDVQKLDICVKDMCLIYVVFWDGDVKIGWNYFFGIDQLGCDIFVNLLEGGCVLMVVGWFVMVLIMLIGIFVGVIVGFFCCVDGFLMCFIDLVFFLLIFLIMLVVVILFC